MKRIAEKLKRERRLFVPAVRAMATKPAPRAIKMWTQSNKSELVERDEELTFLLDHGCYQQVVEESLAWLKLQPYNLQAVESLLRAQWRAGDMHGALKSVNMALKLNPHEPGYRYMRGLLRQSFGMLGEAMEDFEAALAVGKGELKEHIRSAIKSLEDWQIYLLRILLAEDRMFRLEFAMHAEKAVLGRGFALTSDAKRALVLLVEGKIDVNFDAYTGLS